MNRFNILVVYPRTHMSQIATYQNQKLQFLVNLKHRTSDLAAFAHLTDQVQFRADAIVKELENNDHTFEDMKLVISRGGLIRPVTSGVYAMNDKLREDLTNSPVGENIVNIGGLIADAIAARFPGSRALVADPMTVDELEDVARITGHPNFRRKSIFHALSQKSTAMTYAKSISRNYEDLDLIVAHLGNGITIGAHHHGRVIDVNQGFDGDGPFSLIRSGNLPMGDVIKQCFSGKFSFDEMMCLVVNCGGVLSHLNTTNLNLIESKIESGDEHVRQIMEAMAYQVGKGIGEMFAVLKANVDAILITGDLAHSNFLVKHVVEMVQGMAPVLLYPGDNEVEAMAAKAFRVLKGEDEVKKYSF